MQDQVRIVLVNPSHPGNIGAAARAMKVMGFSQLYLVGPKAFPDPEARARASGADDILESAVVTQDLVAAIGDCHLVFGTSARSRSLPWPMSSPREAAQHVAKHISSGKKIAFVFGREQSGLTNDELAKCHFHVQIPTAPAFSSLNLAAAVQVITYELSTLNFSLPAQPEPEIDELATAGQMDGFYRHLDKVMRDHKFLDPNHPMLLQHRLQRLFNRAHIDKTEYNILRGLLSAIEKKK